MPYSGYPTPDIDPTQHFQCVRIYIPSSVGDVFYQVLLGQIGEMANDWYWQASGTQTPEQCAFLWAQTAALTSADLQECGIMTCQEVADCIDTSTEVQNSLGAYLSQRGYGVGDPQQALPPSIMANSIIPQGALCTDSNKYAMSRAIVQGLDKLAMDFLEVIQLIADRADIAAEIVQAVPIFGGLASLALDFATYINTYVKDTYLAAYNSTTEVDYSCVVYCSFTNCELSWDDVIAAYEEQANIAPPQSTDFVTVMQWLFTNVVANTDNLVVGIMHVFILNCLRYGSNWFGSGVWTALEIAVQDASDEEITVPAQCICSPVIQSVSWDFTINNGGWTLFQGANPRGEYLAGIGWSSTLNAGVEGVIIQKDVSLGGDTVIDAAKVEYELNGSNQAGTLFILRDVPTSPTGQLTIFNVATAPPLCMSNSISSSHRDFALAQLQGGNETNQYVIKKITVRYTGTKPTGYTSENEDVSC